MNRSVKVAKRFAAMADHRLGESGPGFRGNFDGAGDEELVVRKHWGKPSSARLRRASVEPLLLFLLDEADVAAAFEPGDFDHGNVFRFGVEVQVFIEVVL